MAAAESPSMVDGGSGMMLPMLQKVGVDAWLRAHGKTVRPELTKKQKQELKECFDLIDADGSEKSSKQPLPFQLLAQAYRRKKLMEAVMGGDKAAQERLKAKAEEAEAERQAVLAAMEAEKQNPALRYDDKKMRTISDVNYSKIKKAEDRNKLGKEDALSDYIVENLDDDLKHIILESCEMHKGVSQDCVNGEAMSELKTSSDTSNHGSKCGGRVSKEAFPMSFHKQELADLGLHQTRVRHKPVLERQLLHLRAIKSIQEYLESQTNSV